RLRVDWVLALLDDAVLPIREPDEGAGAVAVKTNWVGINARLEAFCTTLRQGSSLHLVPESTDLELSHEDVLHPIALLQRILQPLWDVGLTLSKHIGKLLCIRSQSQ